MLIISSAGENESISRAVIAMMCHSILLAALIVCSRPAILVHWLVALLLLLRIASLIWICLRLSITLVLISRPIHLVGLRLAVIVASVIAWFRKSRHLVYSA